jgi:hypothetical protein
MWLNHLRATDRHRVGDAQRALNLARWGGLGGHRYQVGFSGDEAGKLFPQMPYMIYFAVTSANVGHGYWSHNINGDSSQPEARVRWIQGVGAYGGVLRSHGEGRGACADAKPYTCTNVEPWVVPEVAWPAMYQLAIRSAYVARAALLPYIYTQARAAFDSGVGLLRPMYFHYPELPLAYAMNRTGGTQYMFGPSLLVSPVISAGNASQVGIGPGLAGKATWLPPGGWVCACSGVLTVVPPGDAQRYVSKAYHISETPLFYAAGAVLPYLPLRSLPSSVGNAARQYSFLGWRIVPGSSAGAGSVYEDDGSTTAYLTEQAHATSTLTYTLAPDASTMTITLSPPSGAGYPLLPQLRSYQLHLLNSGPLASVLAGGSAVPFVRYGAVAARSTPPAASQHYYDVSPQPWGMGAVIDLVGVPASALPLILTLTFAAPALNAAAMSGVYGALMHAQWAKDNLDVEHTTPGGDTVAPAYTNTLASLGGTLQALAGAGDSGAGFAQAVADVRTLLPLALQELAGVNSTRASYSVALLESAML